MNVTDKFSKYVQKNKPKTHSEIPLMASNLSLNPAANQKSPGGMKKAQSTKPHKTKEYVLVSNQIV